MNPEKLMEFSKDNMVTKATEKYLHQIVNSEMPHRLKKYLDLELFPRIQLKVEKGVSICTACHWLHQKGFKYMEHKKSLYYDGHNHPDVVHYCQHVFLPAMAEHQKCLVEYVMDDV
jgi:hypothetical protein